MTKQTLKPFWRYYGSKYRVAPRYPTPITNTIIEPFAGAAGYSLRYPDLNVTLIEAYPIVAEIWRYLITTSASEIRRIPSVESVEDLPSWVPEGAKYLVGFCMNDAAAQPRKTLSAGRRRLAAMGRSFEGWSPNRIERVAAQVDRIRHWRVIEGNYTLAPDIPATWFIDPPYNNAKGRHYTKQIEDYAALAAWCRTRRGRVIVCENVGADWLPFQPFAKLKAGVNGDGSEEAIWLNEA